MHTISLDNIIATK